MHQAGSDSLVTIEVFWKLIKNGFVSKEEIIDSKNILYGILKGKDNKETINYTKMNFTGFNNNIDKNINKNKINTNKNINNYQDNWINNFGYLTYGNKLNNMYMNYSYQQIMFNGLYNNMGFNGIRMMSNRNNNIVQYC